MQLPEAKWVKNLERRPKPGVIALCRIVNCMTSAVEDHRMRSVDEDDCNWRFAEDGAEVSFNWTLTEWLEDKHTPQHEHDCKCCVFLGTHDEFDLYYHGGAHWTLIARWGKNGDYMSGPNIARAHSPLMEARIRATNQGLMGATKT